MLPHAIGEHKNQSGDCELNNVQLTAAIEAEGFRECDQDMDLALSWAEMSACIVS